MVDNMDVTSKQKCPAWYVCSGCNHGPNGMTCPVGVARVGSDH